MTADPTPEHPYPTVELALDEGRKILDKLGPDAGRAPFVAVGALAFGLLKAIMECPNCPGHFRVPVMHSPDGAGIGHDAEGQVWAIDHNPGSDWMHIACMHCGNIWHHI